MENQINLLEAIIPEVLEIVEERFTILRNIQWMSPVGRRTLAQKLNTTERALRTETDILRQLQLINISKSGMTLTAEGERVLQELEELMSQVSGMKQKEQQLAQLFNIGRCTIVSGDCDQDSQVLEEFGKSVTEALNQLLPAKENIIAVMGGTTMAGVASQMSLLEPKLRHNIFVPARGGVGESIDIQANSVSELMAKKTGGRSRSLFVPERVSQETYQSLLQEPSVQDVLQLIHRSTCVIHSVGNAMHMAQRRGMSDEELRIITEGQAVGESFGYFFNKDGDIVYKIPRIGLQLNDLKEIPFIIAVTGGKAKSQAITSYMNHAPSQTWLITDEGAANEILKGVTL
ncbi:sugar-binding transcriptional regulator [Vagococcus xieshaowenii]|uniref:SorC family transcriptional regulator n=1 Tax=Vagococcus xieshaowenii TaxID=2562451 RepID=A0AAJ5EDW7_9ENTE|nr:sugar-binding domain-containing protein [Vagococcus xieshaowenii]QCA28754.1 SorC family transcriptional regulator [Vagococcus xieshaowenii]TFZ40661.1 SorC family transcriptional regulator [Vagococcus xieshaowenii]